MTDQPTDPTAREPEHICRFCDAWGVKPGQICSACGLLNPPDDPTPAPEKNAFGRALDQFHAGLTEQDKAYLDAMIADCNATENHGTPDPEALDPAADLDERQRRIWGQEKYDALRQRAEAAEAERDELRNGLQAETWRADAGWRTADELHRDLNTLFDALASESHIPESVDDAKNMITEIKADNAKLRERVAELEHYIQPMSTAPRDGSWIIGIHIEMRPPRSKFIRWSDSYSIHGLGGHWTEGVGQYGDLHFAGWIDGSAAQIAAKRVVELEVDLGHLSEAEITESGWHHHFREDNAKLRAVLRRLVKELECGPDVRCGDCELGIKLNTDGVHYYQNEKSLCRIYRRNAALSAARELLEKGEG